MDECANYFGFGSFKELFEEIFIHDQDIEFYYKNEKYLISTEPIGSRRHKVIKRCFSYQQKGHEVYLKTLQTYDTWEELFEKACFQDGTRLIDAMKRKE